MNNKAKSDGRSQTLGMVQVALFAALIIIMAFTPFLGYIPLGFTRATIIHVPVIIGSILLGPKKGAVLGGIFGLTSFINNTMNPTVTSFVFTPFYSLGEMQGGIDLPNIYELHPCLPSLTNVLSYLQTSVSP